MNVKKMVSDPELGMKIVKKGVGLVTGTVKNMFGGSRDAKKNTKYEKYWSQFSPEEQKDLMKNSARMTQMRKKKYMNTDDGVMMK